MARKLTDIFPPSTAAPITTRVNGYPLTSDVNLTASDIGLGNVLNAEQVPVSEKGTANGVAELGADGKVPSGQLPESSNAVTSVAGKTGAVSLIASDVGLGNVLNVAQIPASQKGVANGVASLGSDGKVPASQLPAGGATGETIDCANVLIDLTQATVTDSEFTPLKAYIDDSGITDMPNQPLTESRLFPELIDGIYDVGDVEWLDGYVIVPDSDGQTHTTLTHVTLDFGRNANLTVTHLILSCRVTDENGNPANWSDSYWDPNYGTRWQVLIDNDKTGYDWDYIDMFGGTSPGTYPISSNNSLGRVDFRLDFGTPLVNPRFIKVVNSEETYLVQIPGGGTIVNPRYLYITELKAYGSGTVGTTIQSNVKEYVIDAKGAPGGYASLGLDGKILAEQVAAATGIEKTLSGSDMYIIRPKNGNVQTITLSSDTSISFEMPPEGQIYSVRVIIKQSDTDTWNVTWDSVKWAGSTAPTITTTNSATDIFAFLITSTDIYGVFNQNFVAV